MYWLMLEDARMRKCCVWGLYGVTNLCAIFQWFYPWFVTLLPIPAWSDVVDDHPVDSSPAGSSWQHRFLGGRLLVRNNDVTSYSCKEKKSGSHGYVYQKISSFKIQNVCETFIFLRWSLPWKKIMLLIIYYVKECGTQMWYIAAQIMKELTCTWDTCK